MSDRSQTQNRMQRHLQLWIYLLPVVGVVPAIWTLYRTKSNSLNADRDRSSCQAALHRQKISRLSINLSLVWLGSYLLCSWGAGNASEILSFRLLYANAIITTGYFVTCTYLMSRLGKKSLLAREDLN